MHFLKTLILTLTFGLSLALCAFPAHSAALNAEQSQHLKSMFEEIITGYKAQKDNENVTLLFDGNVESEITKTHYAITLPHASLNYTNGSKINIGFITINAKPAKIDGGWSMSIAIPSPIELINKEGKSTGQINIGKQSMAGIWMEEEKLFLKLDSKYSDIEITDTQKTTAFKIPELTLKLNFDKDKDELWSGPAQFKIKGLNTTLHPTGDKLSVGEIAGYARLEKYNPKALQKNREVLTTIRELKQSQKAKTPEHTVAFLNLLFEIVKNSFDDTKFGVKIEDIKIKNPLTLSNLTAPQSTNIDNAHISFELNNIMQNASGIRIRTGFAGVKSQGKSEIEDFLPSDMLLDITLDKIPVEQLITLATNTTKNMKQNPQINGLSAISLMLKLPAILSAAGTNLQIKQNYLTGTDYNVDLNGRIKADIVAANSATGNAKAIITGLDNFIEKAEAKLETMKNKQEKQKLQSTLIQLKNIKNFTKEIKAEDGSVSHEIDFVMAQDGKMLLNGADISLLSMVLGNGNMMKNFMPK